MISNWQIIKELLIKLTGQENIVAIPKIFIELTGDLHLALLLSQVIYWSDKGKRNDGYIYKSAREWKEELGISQYAIDKFKRLKYIECKIIKACGAPTTHYKINYDIFIGELEKFILENKEVDLLKTENPFTEIGKTLTENTTITTYKDKRIKANNFSSEKKSGKKNYLPRRERIYLEWKKQLEEPY